MVGTNYPRTAVTLNDLAYYLAAHTATVWIWQFNILMSVNVEGRGYESSGGGVKR